MKTLRKWWKPALAVVLLVVVGQIGASLLVRTKRVHHYLVAHLERAFGRPVEVGTFGVQILPSPSLDAEMVTVGEDPAFGNEYFLRAEHLTAGLRWWGFFRGHFEFGTVSLSKPSLILVRNEEGRWNLERWLPPAKTTSNENPRIYGPPAAPPEANRLHRIEFDEGRVNFKEGDDKLPFAFINVSGSVDQISSGKWQLQLNAEPWRSGVSLQSAGTVKVTGDLAGTSARLQPAQIHLNWYGASLADLFRLFHGQDFGVRGTFALDASLSSSEASKPGDWTFAVQARTTELHRWDLTERADNPRLNVNLKGVWNPGVGTLTAEQMVIETPKSNLRGMASLNSGALKSVELRVDSLGVQAEDLLAWYRAFHPGVAEGLTAEQFFTGGILLRGWPLHVDGAALSSIGGIVRVPGWKVPVRIGPVSGGRVRTKIVFDPVRIALGGEPRDVLTPKKRRVASSMENAADITVQHDLNTQQGSISVEGHVAKVEDVLKLAAALGRPLNHGWELAGDAVATVHWDWTHPFHGLWNGQVGLNNAQLAVAGLNQPLKVQEGGISWTDGQPSARLLRVEGFGATWTGDIRKIASGVSDADVASNWRFSLAADHLDAGELDRWVGPRARPGWVQRLMVSLLGGGSGTPNFPASELVRRINAEGELRVDELTVEKLKLANVRAKGSLRDLKLEVPEAEAQWAGGNVRAKVSAKFAPLPEYDIAAELDRVNLAQMPAAGHLVEKLAGTASGTIHLVTDGVGREQLIKQLEGGGEIRLKDVEFRGWDVNASVLDGAAHTGISRWTTGHGVFAVRNSSILLEGLRLESPKELTLVNGTVTFAREADLSIEAENAATSRQTKAKFSSAEHVLKLSGPLDGPRVSVEKASIRQPAD